LAALGSVAGGEMLTGAAVVGAIPLVVAFAFAFLAYGLMRWLEPAAAESLIRTS
jgi:hypothetical protein